MAFTLTALFLLVHERKPEPEPAEKITADRIVRPRHPSSPRKITSSADRMSRARA
jgi:hypothetical protein